MDGLSEKFCTILLVKAVYSPGGCILSYMEQIMGSLQEQAPLLWTPQNASIIDEFKAKYNVELNVIDAFGLTTFYVYATDAETLDNLDPTAPLPMSSTIQRAAVMGHGFAADEINYDYTSRFWNRDGQMVFIRISMSKNGAPFICYEF